MQTGDAAEARERANRELPGIEYPQTKSTVFPPAGWEEEQRGLLKRSGQVPSKALEMEYVYGYNCEANGRNCFQIHDGATCEPYVMIIAVSVIHPGRVIASLRVHSLGSIFFFLLKRSLVFFVAAVVVVHNPATKAQRFFLVRSTYGESFRSGVLRSLMTRNCEKSCFPKSQNSTIHGALFERPLSKRSLT